MNTIDLISYTHQVLARATQEAFDLGLNTFDSVDVTLVTDPAKRSFGDITTNLALILARHLATEPRTVAKKLIAQIIQDPEIVHLQRIEIAGPGFINIWLQPSVLIEASKKLFQDRATSFRPAIKNPERYNVEFVSANPTGPLHLGHGRGGIIGDVLSRILSFMGHDVTREYYINNAGTQIALLGTSLQVRCEQLLGKTTVLPENAYQGKYLITLAERCIEEHGPAILTKQPVFFASYASEALLTQIQKTLESYGIMYDVWFSEKSLHKGDVIDKALDKLDKAGFLYTKDGARWFRSTDFGDDKDRVLQKSTGEYTYMTADIAYLENKLSRGFTQLIYVLGQDHHSYVARLKAAIAALGYRPEQLHVILYQLVSISEENQAVRMSKRQGRIVTLHDIIRTVGTDVARFFYLNRKAEAHLDFDINKALKTTEENPVYYIQYAYVRTVSIREKAGEHEQLASWTVDDAEHLGPEELELVKKILELRVLIERIGVNWQTHLLTYYAIELTSRFHSYYAACRVLDPEEPAKSRARLLLVDLVGMTLKTIFDLIGIQAIERM